MNILTLNEVKRLAGIYPACLDVFSKMYSVQSVSTLGVVTLGVTVNTTVNRNIPAYFYLKISDNEYFYLDGITASYQNSVGGVVPKTESPTIRMTDISRNKIFSAGNTTFIAINTDTFFPIQGNLTPADIDAAPPHNEFTYVRQFPYIFPPQGQLLIELLNPTHANSLTVNILFHGFAVRINKV